MEKGRDSRDRGRGNWLPSYGRTRDEESYRASHGGYSPDEDRSPRSDPPEPNLHIPEDISPRGLVEVKFAQPNVWRTLLEKTTQKPERYKSVPETASSIVDISDDCKFQVAVTPPYGERNTVTNQMRVNALRVSLNLLDGEGKNDYYARTQSSVNKRKYGTYFQKAMGKHLDWTILQDSDYKSSYETPSKSIVDASGSFDFRITFKHISPGKIPEIMHDIKHVASVFGDLAVQLFAEDTPDEPLRLELNSPKLVERQRDGGSEKNGENASDMVTNFTIEDYRVDVEGFTLESIGGNTEVKEEIEGLIELFANREHFAKFGAQAPSGVLFYGSPGTGKTLGAKVVASSLGIPFYKYSASDLVSVWVGESPKIVKKVFEAPEEPSVIFFDEIDALTTHREHSSGTELQIIQELLQQMDGLQSRSDLIVMGATNNIGAIDTAFLRPGRFDTKILVDLPDEAGRKEIFSIHAKNAVSDASEAITLFDHQATIVDQLPHYASVTEGFSGADIAEVIRRAVFALARKTLHDPSAVIERSDIESIITKIKNEKEYDKVSSEGTGQYL